jgi:hypothetical protein
MFGLDERLAQLAEGEGLLIVLAVALLLGLRHATDPDHVAAVSTLIASDPEDGARRARRLGFLWGVGHALALLGFGLPIVLFRGYLPEPLQHALEALVGVVIVVLALRLLLRLRRGRSPRQAFGIGLLHGAGGSAGVGVLVVAAIPGEGQAVAALVVLALGTAVAMAGLAAGMGHALARGPALDRTVALAPAMGAVTLAFGAWYTLGAVGAVPYVL